MSISRAVEFLPQLLQHPRVVDKWEQRDHLKGKLSPAATYLTHLVREEMGDEVEVWWRLSKRGELVRPGQVLELGEKELWVVDTLEKDPIQHRKWKSPYVQLIVTRDNALAS